MLRNEHMTDRLAFVRGVLADEFVELPLERAAGPGRGGVAIFRQSPEGDARWRRRQLAAAGGGPRGPLARPLHPRGFELSPLIQYACATLVLGRRCRPSVLQASPRGCCRGYPAEGGYPGRGRGAGGGGPAGAYRDERRF